MPLESLSAQLDDHLDRVRAAASDHEFVDLAAAEELHAALRARLESWHGLDERQRSILTEAVAYLVRTDDDEDDLRSPIGLDDDAEVIDDALRRL